MSTDGFVLHLGSGVYLMPDGSVVNKPSPDATVLQAPDGLPLDPKAIKEALTDTKEALDKIRANKQVQLTLRVWSGAAGGQELLGVLAGIGTVVAAIAPVFGFVGMVLSVATLLGFLRSGPTAFESQVLARLDELDARAVALGTGLKLADLGEQQTAIQGLLDVTAPLTGLLTSEVPPTEKEIAEAVAAFNAAYNDRSDTVKKAVAPLTWRTLAFNRSAYKALEQISPSLVSSPADDTWVPARLPSNNEHAFDHRMMVPMALWATTTFLTCIRSIKPTHRTSGDHVAEIRTFAENLETLARELRATGLARTRHTASDFAGTFPDSMVSGSLFGSEPRVLRPESCRWVVGAVDMRNFDNQYVYVHAAQGAATSRQYGLLTWGWQPPARLKLYRPPSGISANQRSWTIDNPEECAEAANRVAVERYAQLLSESGYFQLLQTASVCRSEATEPSISQTLDPPQSQMVVMASEPPAETEVAVTIPITRAVIASSASRTVRSVGGTVRVRTGGETETVRRFPRYRIALRTLEATEVRDEEGNPSYWDYQKPVYHPQTAGGRDLVLHLPTGSAVDEHYILHDWTTSPLRSSIRPGTASVQLRAETFDWWVPVPDPVQGMVVSPLATLRELGWVGGLVAGRGVSGAPVAPLGDHVLDAAQVHPWHPATGSVAEVVASVGYAPPVNAQVRDVVVKRVEVTYSLDWSGTDLVLELRTRPEDRNFLVFLVLEEHFLQSGQVLHTAIPLPVNSSITEVPKSFFEREEKAWRAVGPAIRDMIPVQIPSIEDIRPPGPVEFPAVPDWRLRQALDVELDRAIRERPEHFGSVLRRHRLNVDTPYA